MRRKIIFLVILAVFFCNCLKADTIDNIVPEPCLPKTEELVFKVKWLCIPVGTITARINGIKNINGRDAYEFIIIAKTNDFCSSIYRVDDRYISYVDVKEMYPLRHEVYRREGRYKKDAATDFDQVNHKAYFENFLNNTKKVVDIPPRVQDPVSMAYHFRLVPLRLGEMKKYSVYNNESVYQLYGLIDKKASIKTKNFGKKEVFHVQPYAKLKGEVVRKGTASAYFGCDNKRVPFVGIVKGPVFTEVVAYLVSIREE